MQFSPALFWFQEVGLSVALSAAAFELSRIRFRFVIALPSKSAQLEEPPLLSAVQLVVPGVGLGRLCSKFHPLFYSYILKYSPIMLSKLTHYAFKCTTMLNYAYQIKKYIIIHYTLNTV